MLKCIWGAELLFLKSRTKGEERTQDEKPKDEKFQSIGCDLAKSDISKTKVFKFAKPDISKTTERGFKKSKAQPKPAPTKIIRKKPRDVPHLSRLYLKPGRISTSLARCCAKGCDRGTEAE